MALCEKDKPQGFLRRERDAAGLRMEKADGEGDTSGPGLGSPRTTRSMPEKTPTTTTNTYHHHLTTKNQQPQANQKKYARTPAR